MNRLFFTGVSPQPSFALPSDPPSRCRASESPPPSGTGRASVPATALSASANQPALPLALDENPRIVRLSFDIPSFVITKQASRRWLPWQASHLSFRTHLHQSSGMPQRLRRVFPTGAICQGISGGVPECHPGWSHGETDSRSNTLPLRMPERLDALPEVDQARSRILSVAQHPLLQAGTVTIIDHQPDVTLGHSSLGKPGRRLSAGSGSIGRT